MRKLPPEVLRGLLRGIEKEGLRVRADGMLSSAPHPEGLGAALTHPHITTDFSESQLELITGVHADVDDCLRELTELHQVVYRQLGNELLWCASMPCKLPPDDLIPIARYGSSNVARLKTVYRHGLAHRYGRRMQVISGIHYNFSLPESAWAHLHGADGGAVPADLFRDQRYLALIRNFRRHSWLLLLLLGTSPAACGSFVAGRNHGLAAWETGSVFAPGATSLRMGRLGYQSDAQSSLAVSFNDLGGYAKALGRALTEPYPAYEAIGLREGDDYLQLSTSLLQLENEFYGTIRPKRRTLPDERPLRALGERGIEYVEVRCLDVSPFSPVGIDADDMRLLDIFLLHCLLGDSPPDSPREIEAISRNQRLVAEKGRDPLVRLDRAGVRIAPADWGADLLLQFEPIAAALDEAHGGGKYRGVLADARRALGDLSSLPSARVLRETQAEHGTSFPDFALTQSLVHQETLAALPLAAEVEARYAKVAQQSLAEQRRIEAGDDVPFETYRQGYLGQELLAGPHFRPGH
ncbi:MAG TPA: glutamate--cysteine ligase [Usitatibacteraceae bacterium]|nr:glutamate--cysteine ligase [Usitatibacteraceae bacterium]